MKLWTWARSLLSRSRHAFDSAPRPIDQMIGEMLRSGGMSIGRAEALSIPAVQKGRNSVCSIATLPLEQIGPGRVRVASPLLRQIDPDVANVVTLAMTIEDLLFDGIAWWQITAQDFAGFPVAARHVSTSNVSLQPPEGQPSPLPAGQDPRGVAFVWVDGHPVHAAQMIRFDSPNPGLLKVGGSSIRRAVALYRAAQTYADDPRPLDYLTPSPDADPVDDDKALEIVRDWRAARRRRSTAWVPASITYGSVSTPTPQELQLVELIRQANLDIALEFGIDPEELGISTTSRTYFNAADRQQTKINEQRAPLMSAITDRLSMGDVTRRGHVVEFDLAGYLKADPTTRWAVYEKGLAMGVLSVEEIREQEGLPAGAPEQSTTGTPPAPAGGQPALSARPHTFTTPALTMTMSVPTRSFSVDTARRVISGLAVPYGMVGVKGGQKFRFNPGSLQFSEVSRVKHYRDHVTPIGRALSLVETAEGMHVQLSVVEGAAGDELLALAQGGVYDGLSVGVDFDEDPRAGDVSMGKDGVFDVHRADLREITTTPMPAFDTARVTSVAASRTTGGTMYCTHCGQPQHAAGVACPTLAAAAVVTAPPAAPPTNGQGYTVGGQNYSVEQLNLLLAQLNQQHQIAPGHVPPNPNPPPDPNAPVPLTVVRQPDGTFAVAGGGRQFVDPTRTVAAAKVTEAPAYRFDRKGNLCMGTHDFSKDLHAYVDEGDSAARDRVMDFVRHQFDVVGSNVDELNPTKQRPDLYVDQRDFRYPIWDAINKGTLTDVTPFAFPKFSSAASLVGAHTEGTEPSSGTFVTTSQTVTPTPLSGKAKISRETWDQGGNPQISNLIWRQMQKAWFEALEAAAVVALDAVTPTAIALTAGGGTLGQTLAAELKAALTALQFVRGGFTMDRAFTQIDLYKALSAAQDDSKRPLFPMLGPANADGTVEPRLSSINVNGSQFLPAWALAATGVVVASSYLFDRDCVHGWASAPMRLDITTTEVANVYIGLWGYKATAISDITGVREITYDPVA